MYERVFLGSPFRGAARNAAVAVVWMGRWWCAARTAQVLARSVILWEVYLLGQGSLTVAQNAATLIGPALLGCVLPCTPSRDRLEASWDLLAELLARRRASS